MALNGAHAGKGVLIFSGECIILFCENVSMEFVGNMPSDMKGSHTGRLYLTTHRIIFNTKDSKDKLQSFAAPFFCLRQVELEQPVFGANYIKGGIAAQPDGGFSGIVKFKLTFKHGGAIEFGQSMLKVVSMANRNTTPQWREAPPPYTPPQAQWSAAPPPAYAPPQAGYYGWAPPTNTFPDRPPADGVFMYEAPPPYPGVELQNGQAPNAPAMGFVPPPYAAPNGGAFYDPNNPQVAYVPPPPYSPTAPVYGDIKKSQ